MIARLRNIDWYLWVVGSVWVVGLVSYSWHLVSRELPSNEISTVAGLLNFGWSELAMAGLAGFVMLVIEIEALRLRLDPSWVRKRTLGIIFWGIVLGRLQIVLFPPLQLELYGMLRPAAFWANPILILDFSRGGIALSGFLIGAFGYWLFALWRAEQPLKEWLEATVIGAAAGLAVGWWIRFLAADFYGNPTAGTWGMWIPELLRWEAFAAFERFRPLFLYEGFFALITLGWMVWASKRNHRFPLWWWFGIGYSSRIVLWLFRWNVSAPSYFGLVEVILHGALFLACLWAIPRLSVS